MEHVVLVIHLIITVALIVMVLLQRSEGGGLGIGGGGGGLGGFASQQSTANVMTKITTWMAIAFFTTCLILALMASRGDTRTTSIIDAAPAETSAPAADTTKPTEPAVPIAK